MADSAMHTAAAPYNSGATAHMLADLENVIMRDCGSMTLISSFAPLRKHMWTYARETRNDLLIGLPHSEIRWHKCHSLKLEIGFSYGISFIHSRSSAKNVEFHNPRHNVERDRGRMEEKIPEILITKLCVRMSLSCFLFVAQLWNCMNCHRLVGISMPVRVLLSLHICCVPLCRASHHRQTSFEAM